MPVLDNAKLETFAQGLANDLTAEKAAKEAGYSDRSNHSRLRAKREKVVVRVHEIRTARKGDPDLGPVIDALMAAAKAAAENTDTKLTPAGLLAIRALLAEAGRLKGLVPPAAQLEPWGIEPDLDDETWMARFGPKPA